MTQQVEATGMAAWVVDVMEALGGPGAGLLIALENLFPPLPSEVVLPLAGFAAGQGAMTLAEALGWTTAGSVVGALVLYGLGAALGRHRVRLLWRRLPLVRLDDLDRTEAWFARHGRKAVLLGRMVPVFRSLVSVPAGVERMPVAVFTALTLAGSLVWNTALVMAGYVLGDQWHRVEAWTGGVKAVTVVAVACLGMWWSWRLLERRRVEAAAGRRVDRPGDARPD